MPFISFNSHNMYLPTYYDSQLDNNKKNISNELQALVQKYYTDLAINMSNNNYFMTTFTVPFIISLTILNTPLFITQNTVFENYDPLSQYTKAILLEQNMISVGDFGKALYNINTLLPYAKSLNKGWNILFDSWYESYSELPNFMQISKELIIKPTQLKYLNMYIPEKIPSNLSFYYNAYKSDILFIDKTAQLFDYRISTKFINIGIPLINMVSESYYNVTKYIFNRNNRISDYDRQLVISIMMTNASIFYDLKLQMIDNDLFFRNKSYLKGMDTIINGYLNIANLLSKE